MTAVDGPLRGVENLLLDNERRAATPFAVAKVCISFITLTVIYLIRGGLVLKVAR